MEETVAKKALRLLEPIPSENFIHGEFTNRKDKCCVIGHYQRLISDDPSDYSRSNCADETADSPLRISSKEFLKKKLKVFDDISTVNNDYNIFSYSKIMKKYSQKNRKRRVIACLKDMIKAGY